MANVIKLAEQEYPRIPKGEKKTSDASAGMDYNSHIDKWGNKQVPENARLAKFYQNPTGSGLGGKRTIDESMNNGGKFETEAGETPSIKNHAVGHLGTHKI